MRKILFTLAITGVMTFAMGLSQAHHSMSMFDPHKEITVAGVVKQFQYTNPHVWLLVDVTNEDGTTTTWGFEGNAPSHHRVVDGIRRNTFVPGMKVTVTGRPMRDGRPAAAWLRAVTEDGTVYIPTYGEESVLPLPG